MEVPYSREELAEILKSLLKEMDDSEIFVYWQLTKRERPSGSTPSRSRLQTKSLDHAEAGFPGRTVKNHELITQEDTRFLHCNIKTLNLIPNVMAIRKPTRPAVTNVYSTGATS